MPDTYVVTPRTRVQEGSTLRVRAYFVDPDTDAPTAPTTVRYRVDDLSTNQEMVGWTSVTAATEVIINVAASANVINDQTDNRERRQITVEADAGLSTATRDQRTYFVENIRGIGVV